MAEYMEQDGSAPESSPGYSQPTPTPDSSAGTLNTGQQPGAVTDGRGNVIPETRVQQMMERALARQALHFQQQSAAERQQLIDHFSQQSQTNQRSLIQALQQKATTTPRSPEEEQQRQLALKALSDLIPDHPELKRLSKTNEVVPVLTRHALETAQRLEAMEQRAEQQYLGRENERLEGIGRKMGISDAQLPAFTQHVTGIIRSDPDAHKALLGGNTKVVDWAVKQVQGFYANQRAQTNGALAQTKNSLRGLPPRTGGSAPGAPAPPKLTSYEPDAIRAYEKAMQARALASLGG